MKWGKRFQPYKVGDSAKRRGYGEVGTISYIPGANITYVDLPKYGGVTIRFSRDRVVLPYK